MQKKLLSTFLLGLCLIVVSCSWGENPQPKNVKDHEKEVQSSKVGSTNGNEEIKGVLLGGGKFNFADHSDKKMLLGFFSYKHKDALPMLKALEKLTGQEKKYNYEIIAISIDYNDIDGLKKFVSDHKLELPVLVEGANLKIAEKFNIESEVAFVGLNAQHEPEFGVKRYIFAGKPSGEEQFISYVKENLGINVYQPMEPRLGYYPKIPEFSIQTHDGKEIKSSQYLGKVLHLIFFSPKCPHCKRELKFMNDKLYPEYHKKGYEVLAVTSSKMKDKTLESYESNNFPWPFVEDTKQKIKKMFTTNRSVPESFLIDQKGFVRYHSLGFGADKDKMYHLQLKHLLGLENPVNLSDKKYAGEKTCQICHEPQYIEWSVSQHAKAWETLFYKSEHTNAECLNCHTLGFGEKQGYQVYHNKKTGKTIAHAPRDLKGVQCEACHGLGGPHVTKKNPISEKTIKKTCTNCHTKKWSPDFDFEKALPRINHSHYNKIMGMSLEEREELISR